MRKGKRDGFGHEKPNNGETNDWITPPEIVAALGEFDLDPCECIPQPWKLARRGYNINDDGLKQKWDGRVWCNPPYGDQAKPWIERLAQHGNGIALIFARTETKLFQETVFPNGSGYLFIRRRVEFYRPDGTKPKSSSGAPSVLVAFGEENRAALIQACEDGTIPGAYFDLAFYTGSPSHYPTLSQKESVPLVPVRQKNLFSTINYTQGGASSEKPN